MNDIEEINLRKLIVYHIAQSHPDTMGIVKADFNKEIIYGINQYEISELINGDYIPEFNILLKKIKNEEL